MRSLGIAAAVRLCLLGVLCAPVAATGQTFADSRCRFSAAALPPVGANPYAVASADLTGDGRDEIASANEGGNSITVLKALADGQFESIGTLATAVAPRDLALVDVSGDGKADLLAVAFGSDSLQVWLGLGNGSFAAPSTYAAGDGPSSLVVVDLDGNGLPDAVVADEFGSQLSIFWAAGGGAFAPRVAWSVAAGPNGIAIADFNGDGKLDMATSNGAADSVSVLRAQGGGGFGAAQSYAVGSQPRDLVAADLDQDGHADLAVANWNSASVTTLHGLGNGGFAAGVHSPVPDLPTALAHRDLDADGLPELVVVHETSFPNQISILGGLPGGGFGAPYTLAVSGLRPKAVAFGDFDANGTTDIALAAYSGNQASVLGNGCAPVLNVLPRVDADLGSSYELRKSPLWADRTKPLAYTTVMIHQDVDRDGDTDFIRSSIVVSADTPIEILANNAGTFTDVTQQLIPEAHPPMRFPRKGLSGDYNDDGWPEFVIIDHGDDFPPFPGAASALYLSDGKGKLRYSPQLQAHWGFNHGGASGDIDGNGSQDILLLEYNKGPYFLVNDGLGHFSRDTLRLPSEMMRSGYNTTELVDIDLDGFVDIVVSGNNFDSSEPGVEIYWGNSTGLYRGTSRTLIPKPPGNGGVLDFGVEDIDHDGDRDLIVSRFPDFYAKDWRYLQILPQVAPRQFVDETPGRMTMTYAIPAFDFMRVQDINGDGHPDILADDKRFESGEYAWTNDGTGVFKPYFGPVAPRLPYTTIAIADVGKPEGDGGTGTWTFTVRLNRPATSPVTFDIATLVGTASAGSDFVSKASSGVVIGVGESSASFSVTVTGDASVEQDEAFIVQLSAVTGAKVLRGRAYGYIENDDAYKLSVNDVSIGEGHAGQVPAAFTISLSPMAPVPVSVDVRTAPGTARPDVDFGTVEQAGLVIPAGQASVPFPVPVIGDTMVEMHETFTVNLSNAVGALIADGQGLGRITNDDLAQLSISDAQLVEGQSGHSTLAFEVSLSRPMPNPVTFDIGTSGGSATAGVDFVARSLSGRFLDAGRSRWRFEVSILGDVAVEADETFTVTLSNVVGAGLADGTALGTIVNDDAAALRKSQSLRKGRKQP